MKFLSLTVVVTQKVMNKETKEEEIKESTTTMNINPAFIVFVHPKAHKGEVGCVVGTVTVTFLIKESFVKVMNMLT